MFRRFSGRLHVKSCTRGGKVISTQRLELLSYKLA